MAYSWCLFFFCFFFFKQKTAYEMRISDWSSDVCSSDLLLDIVRPCRLALALDFVERAQLQCLGQGVVQQLVHAVAPTPLQAFFDRQHGDLQIGRASCRERVCQYV